MSTNIFAAFLKVPSEVVFEGGTRDAVRQIMPAVCRWVVVHLYAGSDGEIHGDGC